MKTRIKGMGIYKQIGEKIRKLRITKGLSQKELASYVGVTYQQIQNYEKGKSKIPVDRLIKIAEALEVSLDYFLKEFDNNHDRVPDSELELLKTYYKNITNEKVRKQILSLLHTLANELS
ncbi:MAG: helix-turn-helix transcriptional regulator [Aquificota bacterium]|jgi:transcriptional regulator with XRE-family HTH domain